MSKKRSSRKLSSHHLVPKARGGKFHDGKLDMPERGQEIWHNVMFYLMTIHEIISQFELWIEVFGDTRTSNLQAFYGPECTELFGDVSLSEVLEFLRAARDGKVRKCRRLPLVDRNNNGNGNGNGNGSRKESGALSRTNGSSSRVLWNGDRTTIRRFVPQN